MSIPQLERERSLLRTGEAKGGLARIGAYTRLSGPGWLQSAITLGGGSLSTSLFLGVLGGVSLLWIQPPGLATAPRVLPWYDYWLGLTHV